MTSPKRKLLILEDDPAVAEALRRELAPLDLDVQVAVLAEDPYFVDSIDMLCVLGHDGHLRRLSPAWERTLGFTIEELQSRPFIEFVHPGDGRPLEPDRARGGLNPLPGALSLEPSPFWSSPFWSIGTPSGTTSRRPWRQVLASG